MYTYCIGQGVVLENYLLLQGQIHIILFFCGSVAFMTPRPKESPLILKPPSFERNLKLMSLTSSCELLMRFWSLSNAS